MNRFVSEMFPLSSVLKQKISKETRSDGGGEAKGTAAVATNETDATRSKRRPTFGDRQIPVYRFGEFEVDIRLRELRRRGLRVKLQEHPFRVLEALVEEPGKIVTREELCNRLWGQDVHVDFDGGINAAVRKLRLALADSAANPTFIETRPKVGYRFLASVQTNCVRTETESSHTILTNAASSIWTGILAFAAAAIVAWWLA